MSNWYKMLFVLAFSLFLSVVVIPLFMPKLEYYNVREPIVLFNPWFRYKRTGIGNVIRFTFFSDLIHLTSLNGIGDKLEMPSPWFQCFKKLGVMSNAYLYYLVLILEFYFASNKRMCPYCNNLCLLLKY